METIAKNYELAYLLDSKMSDEELARWQENFKNFLSTEIAGELKKEVNVKKRRLAYPIKKQTLAYFGSYIFTGLPEKVEALDTKLKTEPQILRHLIIKVNKRLEKETTRKEKEILEKVFSPKKEVPREEAVIKPAAIDTEKIKVGLEELDKKIEEILNEPK